MTEQIELLIVECVIAVIFFIVGYFFYDIKKIVKTFLPHEMKEMEEGTEVCENYGKRIMCWGIPFLAGAVIDQFRPGIGLLIAVVAFIVLVILSTIDMLGMMEKRYMNRR